MKKRVWIAAMSFALVVSAQGPTCHHCSATYIGAAELDTYLKRAIDNGLIDQQVRSVDVGKSQVGIGIVHRGKLLKPENASVAEHDLISEVYHIIDGTATFVTGPDLVNAQRRPATNQNVREFNGPGHNADSIRDGVTYHLKTGDVIVVPAGVGHWFTRIDDHITYLMVRVDPDRAVPLKDEAASQKYLQSPAKKAGEK
jgi:mannose-6-phosphate isomerase-like protein (cupin superfamily)